MKNYAGYPVEVIWATVNCVFHGMMGAHSS
jgi:hypothetical protein